MFPQFDPSKMDPKVLMELSRMIQTLPPQMINRMQSLMHNAMAGYDVKKDMAEFEQQLPPGFREKLMGIMAGAGMPTAAPSQKAEAEIEVSSEPTNLREARITILRAVADGRMSPEDAERTLFA